jgi:hypothetical protein
MKITALTGNQEQEQGSLVKPKVVETAPGNMKIVGQGHTGNPSRKHKGGAKSHVG